MTWLSWSILAALAGPPTLSEAWVVADNPAALRRPGVVLAEGMEERPEGRAWRVHLTPAALESLSLEGWSIEITRADQRRGPPPVGYTDPVDGQAWLAEVAERADAGLVRVGTSVEGRPIDALWLGRPPGSGAPTLRVIGAVHGDEMSSFEVALGSIEALLDRDGRDEGVTALLDSSTVWFLPYANPDGVMAGSRYNANGIDLNRNHDYEWNELEWSSGDVAFSEPETRAIRRMTLWDAHPTASLTLHSGAENIGYVWNFSEADTPEEAHLRSLAERYEDACRRQGFYTTNGAAWYVTFGDTNDWSYGRYGGMDFTVELTYQKTPPSDQIETYVSDHVDAVLEFLTTPVDLSGTVTDAETGRPIVAGVQLLDADGRPLSRRFFTDPATGRFHRITDQTWDRLLVSAPGYDPVETDQTTVALQPTTRSARPDHPFAAAPGAPFALWTRGTTVVFEAPGLPSVVRTMSGSSVVTPETEGLWTVSVDGATWPRSLLVTEQDQVAAVVDGSTATLALAPAPGTRAWALSGPDRTLMPLSVSEREDEIAIDIGPLNADPHDLVVLSGDKLYGWSQLDAPDSGSTSDKVELVRAGGCACNSGGVPLSVSLLTLLVGVLIRRQP